MPAPWSVWLCNETTNKANNLGQEFALEKGVWNLKRLKNNSKAEFQDSLYPVASRFCYCFAGTKRRVSP